MSPVLLHFALVLALSAMALASAFTPHGFGLINGAIALIGIATSVRVIAGLRRRTMDPPPHWADIWWYGVAPCAIYVLLPAYRPRFGQVKAAHRSALGWRCWLCCWSTFTMPGTW